MFASRILQTRDLILKSAVNSDSAGKDKLDSITDELESLHSCLSENDFSSDVLKDGIATIESVRSMIDIYVNDLSKINREVLLLLTDVPKNVTMYDYVNKGKYHNWLTEIAGQKAYYNTFNYNTDISFINYMLSKVQHALETEDEASLKEIVAVEYIETIILYLDGFSSKLSSMLASLNCMLKYLTLVNNALVEDSRANAK